MTTTATVRAFEQDGLKFRVTIPADAPDLTGASVEAWARLMNGGAEIEAASAVIDDAEVVVDFGSSGLAVGTYQVQVKVIVTARSHTIWVGMATISDSLGD